MNTENKGQVFGGFSRITSDGLPENVKIEGKPFGIYLSEYWSDTKEEKTVGGFVWFASEDEREDYIRAALSSTVDMDNISETEEALFTEEGILSEKEKIEQEFVEKMNTLLGGTELADYYAFQFSTIKDKKDGKAYTVTRSGYLTKERKTLRI